VQVYVTPGANFSLEFVLTDSTRVFLPLTQTKRRISYSHTVSKVEAKPFLLRLPSRPLQSGCWTTACFNLNRIAATFKGNQFLSLENITISGTFKLRKIFTTKSSIIVEKEHGVKSLDMYPTHLLRPKGSAFSPSIPSKAVLLDPELADCVELDSELKEEPSVIMSNHSK
jgi:hypothetical protein